MKKKSKLKKLKTVKQQVTKFRTKSSTNSRRNDNIQFLLLITEAATRGVL